MTTPAQSFTSPEFNLRVFPRNGELLVPATDVARCLGYAIKNTVHLVACVENTDLGYAVIPGASGAPRRTIVMTLDGLEHLLSHSGNQLAPVLLAYVRAVIRPHFHGLWV